MLAMIDQIKHTTQLRWNKVHRFKSKINFNIEMGSYLIKTAETSSEIIESFRLRDEVFNQEFRGIEKASLDFDKFDYYFDHLIIVRKDTKKIIGTYRLNCSSYSKESYTALEFDVDSILQTKGPVLELGRACIHKDYRKGSVISLLWRGITEYMNLCEAKILFGCSSVKVSTAREAALIFRYLEDQKMLTNTFQCKPTKKYRFDNFESWYGYFNKGLSAEQATEAESLVPPLLRSYLKLGAKIVCEPAFDEDFDCIDLLTVLKKEDLAEALVKKFQVVK
jgi:putative hemolysin